MRVLLCYTQDDNDQQRHARRQKQRSNRQDFKAGDMEKILKKGDNLGYSEPVRGVLKWGAPKRKSCLRIVKK